MAEFSVVISAGGRAEQGLALALGVTEKCAALFAGEPMVAAPVRAALDAGAKQVVVVCGEETRNALGHIAEDVLFAQPGANPVDSAKRGAALVTGDCALVFLAGDLPLVQAAHLEDFTRRCPSESGAWVAAGVCDRDAIAGTLPGIPGLKYSRLSGRQYAGGGIFSASPAGFQAAVGLAETLSHGRKSQFTMARRFGLLNMARLFLGVLSMKSAEVAAAKVFGCAARIVPDCAPQLIADVDTVADWDFIQSFYG